MTQQKIVNVIHHHFTSQHVYEDLRIFKSFKNSNPHLDWLYRLLVDTYCEFAEENNEGRFDPAIFRIILFKIVD
jgi:hypothetical protein